MPYFLGLGCLLAGLGAGGSPANGADAAAPAATAPSSPLRLPDCLRLASERQPALAAYRATLAAAETGLQGLQSLRLPAYLVQRDLPVRLHQAQLGVAAAQTGLFQAANETFYAVTRTYLSVLYARAQLRVVQDLIAELKSYQDRVQKALRAGEMPRLSAVSADLILMYLRRAEVKEAEAERGLGAAVAALREAMGVDPAGCFTVADEPLPDPQVQVCRADVLARALARRAELIQAVSASDSFVLEVEAQGRTRRPGVVRTLAAGADIHSEPVPQSAYEEHYRPGGIALQMPTVLSGPRWSRTETAQALSARAAAVSDKTRNLIALEAETVFLRWQEAQKKVRLQQEAAEAGSRVSQHLRGQFLERLTGGVENVLIQSALSANERARLNEALFQQVVALADVERVTGGGFSPEFIAQLTRPNR
jgi:outer membrane protein TolC